VITHVKIPPEMLPGETMKEDHVKSPRETMPYNEYISDDINSLPLAN